MRVDDKIRWSRFDAHLDRIEAPPNSSCASASTVTGEETHLPFPSRTLLKWGLAALLRLPAEGRRVEEEWRALEGGGGALRALVILIPSCFRALPGPFGRAMAR